MHNLQGSGNSLLVQILGGVPIGVTIFWHSPQKLFCFFPPFTNPLGKVADLSN